MNDGKDLSASLEQYLATIHGLQSESGRARAGAIAKLCGVHKSSVTAALRVLAELELIEYEPYGAVTLTEAGKAEADRIRDRLRLMCGFLVETLHMDESSALEAAQRMQSSVPAYVMEAIARRMSGSQSVTQVHDRFE